MKSVPLRPAIIPPAPGSNLPGANVRHDSRWLTAQLLSATLFLTLINKPLSLAGEIRMLASPDDRIHISIQMPMLDSNEHPVWSASFQGKSILTNCSLGLRTANAGDLMSGVRVVRERSRSLDQRIRVLFGKSDHANDHFNESRFTLDTPSHRRLDVVFRCYDDAIAFRYELPKDANAGSVTITDETTSFRVQGEPTTYAQYLESYTTSHEHNVTPTPFRDLRPAVLLDMPLTFSWDDGTYAAITEASLRHYAGMSLMRPSSDPMHDGLVCQLTPRPDGSKVVRPLPMETPWRVVLLGNRPGALLESSTLYCLNDPSVIKDVSWIKPGKITFSWWNGDVYDGKRSLPILPLEMAQK
jgi:alpha-glucosidase